MDSIFSEHSALLKTTQIDFNDHIKEFRVLKQYIRTTFPELRRAVRSVKLDEVEFHAMLILIFWFSGNNYCICVWFGDWTQ